MQIEEAETARASAGGRAERDYDGDVASAQGAHRSADVERECREGDSGGPADTSPAPTWSCDAWAGSATAEVEASGAFDADETRPPKRARPGGRQGKRSVPKPSWLRGGKEEEGEEARPTAPNHDRRPEARSVPLQFVRADSVAAMLYRMGNELPLHAEIDRTAEADEGGGASADEGGGADWARGAARLPPRVHREWFATLARRWRPTHDRGGGALRFNPFGRGAAGGEAPSTWHPQPSAAVGAAHIARADARTVGMPLPVGRHRLAGPDAKPLTPLKEGSAGGAEGGFESPETAAVPRDGGGVSPPSRGAGAGQTHGPDGSPAARTPAGGAGGADASSSQPASPPDDGMLMLAQLCVWRGHLP